MLGVKMVCANMEGANIKVPAGLVTLLVAMEK